MLMKKNALAALIGSLTIAGSAVATEKDTAEGNYADAEKRRKMPRPRASSPSEGRRQPGQAVQLTTSMCGVGVDRLHRPLIV